MAQAEGGRLVEAAEAPASPGPNIVSVVQASEKPAPTAQDIIPQPGGEKADQDSRRLELGQPVAAQQVPSRD